MSVSKIKTYQFDHSIFFDINPKNKSYNSEESYLNAHVSDIQAHSLY